MYIRIIVIIIVIFYLWISGKCVYDNYLKSAESNSIENFDGTGYVYNQYPNWFAKKPYDLRDWLVPVYPDMIQPACLPYSVESKWGSLENMNYNSQAYKFWRF